MKLIKSLLLLTILASSPGWSQTYRIDWYSVNSGGGSMSGGEFVINGSAGQSAAGFTTGESILHWVGFWSPEITGHDPVVVESAAAAKLLSDGTLVSIAGKISSSAAGEFSGFFYIQETDRSSGIRVAAAPGDIIGLTRGSIVNVIGTMGTTSAGERQITGPMVMITTSSSPPTPLGMINRTLGGSNVGVPPFGQYGVAGGSGVNNIGLLIRTWGRVTYVDPVGAFVYVDDGSGLYDGSGHFGVKVSTAGLGLSLNLNDFISVTGISSMHKPGPDRHRLVLPRSGKDVNPH